MKRVITLSTNTVNRKHSLEATCQIPNCVFTPSAIVDLLQAIEELNGLEIFHETLEDGSVRFIVGENVYSGMGS